MRGRCSSGGGGGSQAAAAAAAAAAAGRGAGPAGGAGRQGREPAAARAPRAEQSGRKSCSRPRQTSLRRPAWRDATQLRLPCSVLISPAERGGGGRVHEQACSRWRGAAREQPAPGSGLGGGAEQAARGRRLPRSQGGGQRARPPGGRTVVAQEAHGLRQRPLGHGVGGEAAVVDGKGRGVGRVLQVLEEGADCEGRRGWRAGIRREARARSAVGWGGPRPAPAPGPAPPRRRARRAGPAGAARERPSPALELSMPLYTMVRLESVQA